MGPGIFTRYAKQAIGGILAVFLLVAAAALYVQLRSPVAGLSPYETVNDLTDWELMTFTAIQETWPTDTAAVELTFRNDATDGVVCLSADGIHFGYVLEIWQEDGWHSLRTSRSEKPRWDGNTDIVDWNGGEVTLSCPIGRDYPSPLTPGRYRVVLPRCTHLNDLPKALTAEFEVQ